MTRTNLHFAWNNARPAKSFRTGVALHGHTAHSLETLAIVSTYAARSVGLGHLLRELKRRCLESGREGIDYSRLFFTPPLPPLDALDVETRQIEDRLDLDAMVSLTDHDTFDGCAVLHRVFGRENTPYSVEWTVPFGPTYLHLGLHNIPAPEARELAIEMGEASSGCGVCRDVGVACFGAHRRLSGGAAWGGCGLGATSRPLAAVLERVSGFPGALVVLNHPMWDMNSMGDRGQAAVVGRFLGLYGPFVHALEINGLRSWSENLATIQLAESLDCPVVAGGDRHGCEPAAAINLTNATTLAEFVDEVRTYGQSDVLLLPHYREPLIARKVRAACDVLRDDPHHAYGKCRWSDRVFFRDDEGRLRPLSELWPDGDPIPVRASRRAVQSLDQWPLRQAVRFALACRADTAA